jgi:hypothetical protein
VRRGTFLDFIVNAVKEAMKTTKTVLLAGCLLTMGPIVPPLHAQNFTFTTMAGGSQGSIDGSNSNAQFYSPTGVAADNGGNVYVADQKNNLIRKITPSGTNWIVTTIAGGTSGALDGTNTDAQFYSPTGIALDSATNLYVADQFNYTIRKITPSGTNWVVSTIAGLARVSGAQNGANDNARFLNPTGVAVDNAGNIFVADEFNNAIRKVTPDGTNWIVSTIAGGSQGASNGANTAAQFSDPAGVAVDANDRVFVADQFNNTIRLITPSGTNWVVTTIAGQLDAGASNGLGGNAQFNTPVGVALDTNGNVYVADYFNNAVRKMTPSGTNWMVSTIGGGTGGTGNGTGTNAQFYLPFGVATDVFGDIYVADSGNNAIRQGLSSSGTPQTGSLEVTLTPSNAVAAGVEWQLDGGPFQTNGATLSGLTPGVYTIDFSTNSGYPTPANQTVTVTAHQTTTATGNYVNVLNATITLSALPDAGGTVSGDGTFAAGSTNTVTARANSGYMFTNWTQGGSVASTAPSYTFTLGSNVTLAANFLPTCTLAVGAFPAGSGTASAGGTVFPEGSLQTVTATANTGFEFIGWAGEGTGTSNPLTVTLNTNLGITAYFAPIGSMTLTVITNGAGIVSPNLNGRNLKAARRYTLAAIAKSGNVFLGWTGTMTTNKDPLTIMMESSMVLQANFIPNPFLPVKGTYNGLFATSNGVTEQTAGMLRGLTVRPNGTYSGTLLINGAGHAISGSFDLAGQAANSISRPASQGGPLELAMTLDWNDTPPQITGMVSGTTNGVPWMAGNLLADFAGNNLPSAAYTMLIPPDTNNAPPNSSPGGDGYALIANKAGTTRITGALADGTAFSQTTPVSQTGYVPIYANLYAGKGLLLGWINLDLTNTTGVSLTWIHPSRPAGLYMNGFTNVLLTNQILLSPWTDPPASVIGLLTNLSMFDTINDTNALLSFPVTISSLGEIGPTPLSGSINARTGLLKVAIGSGASRMAGYGAILLNETNGGGYFLTETNAQAIQLGQ